LAAAGRKRSALFAALDEHDKSELAAMEAQKTAWPWADDSVHTAHDEARQHAVACREQVIERLDNVVSHYDAVLRQDAQHPRANAELAEVYWQMLRWAEGHADRESATRYLALLKLHDDGRYADIVDGTATLEVQTDPCAKLRLFRIVVGKDGDHALYPLSEQALVSGQPLDIEPGDYLIDARLQDHALALRPVHVPRAADVRVHIRMFVSRRVGADFVLMPAGTFRMGGDPLAVGCGPQSATFVDNVAIGRLPVTRGEYALFLEQLADRDPQKAIRFTPRFYESHDPDPRLPVTGICRDAAEEYCDWISRKTGIAHRLPSEAEWEKAARGTDGRTFVWGRQPRARKMLCRDARCGQPALMPVGSFAEDNSLIGVRDLSGGVAEWTVDDQGDCAVVRGGSFEEAAEAARITRRHVLPVQQAFRNVGFRLVRPLAPGGGEHVQAAAVPELAIESLTLPRAPELLPDIDAESVTQRLLAAQHELVTSAKPADCLQRLLMLCCQLASAERVFWVSKEGELLEGRDLAGGPVSDAHWDPALVKAALEQKRAIALDNERPQLAIPLAAEQGCLVLERRFYRVAFDELQTIYAEQASDLLSLAVRLSFDVG
jgi:hypothetical protein